MADDERVAKLQALLANQPDDPFLLYGLAMEHKKANRPREALEYLDRMIAADAQHGYAYHQRGLVQEMLGEAEAARQSYRDGIEAARKAGDAHARELMEEALALLG